mgnify:CR=1 FL=1
MSRLEELIAEPDSDRVEYVARKQMLRDEIDRIIAEIEVGI